MPLVQVKPRLLHSQKSLCEVVQLPKKKVDNLQGFRIELQESERDLVKNWMLAKTATNTLAALAPIAAPIAGALAAWWVAQWTAGEFKEYLDERVRNVQALYAEGAPEQYNLFTAELTKYNWEQLAGPDQGAGGTNDTSNSLLWLSHQPDDSPGHSFLNWYLGDWRASTRTSPGELEPSTFDPKFDQLRIETMNFITTMGGRSQRNAAIAQGWSPAEAWLEFYTVGRVTNDAIHSMKAAGFAQQAGMAWTFITAPFRDVPDP